MLTEESLKKALHRCFSDTETFHGLEDMFEDKDASKDEIVVAAVEACYSPELLKHLNDKMAYIPICAAKCGEMHTGDFISESIDGSSYVRKCIPLVHPKKLAQIGFNDDMSMGFDGCISYGADSYTWYVDEDGAIVCIKGFWYSVDDAVTVEYNKSVPFGVKYEDEIGGILMDSIEEFFPKEYQGLWQV